MHLMFFNLDNSPEVVPKPEPTSKTESPFIHSPIKEMCFLSIFPRIY